MDKTKIKIDHLLPQIPDEKDECVERFVKGLSGKKGIKQVHLSTSAGEDKPVLCLHFDPSEISSTEVAEAAERSASELSHHYGHLLLTIDRVDYPGHARIIEEKLSRIQGVCNVSVAETGFIQIEFERNKTNQQKILKEINEFDLKIINVDDLTTRRSERGSKEKDKSAKHDHHSCCSPTKEHRHGSGLFGEKSELIFSLICGGFLALGFAFSFIHTLPGFVSVILYAIACFFGGFYTTKEAYEGISNGRFEIDFLMLVAAVGAAILGHWAEAALLLFLFSLGHSLEHYSFEKARKSIAALGNLSPKMGLVKKGEQLIETKIEDLKPGNIIVVKSNSIIAADGIVVRGRSAVNQAPITGESMPVQKSPVKNEMDLNAFKDERHGVFAGTINGAQTLEIKVTRLAKDSTISRLVELVNEAQTQKSPTQTFTDKIERYYVPFVLVLVGVMMLAFLVINESFGASFYRAMAVLVAASPCALALATPSAVLSGVARAARGGVLIKGGRPLEELGRIHAIAFDKTGTLTPGKPELTGVYPLNNFSEEYLLQILIAVEKLSDHPLSVAIVNGAKQKLKKEIAAAESLESITGRGVKAHYENQVIHIGNLSLFIDKKDDIPVEIKNRVADFEKDGNTTMVVQQDENFIGIITVKDVPRKEAADTLLALRKLGIKKMIMLTGDNQLVADSIAHEIGLTEAIGGLLPEQKVEAIEKLMAEGKVAMVGDGVNDAPAMAKSSVGIAMGAAGSDVALETADIALMADKLSTLPFAIGLSKKASSIIRQNLIISIGMVLLLLPLTISGVAAIGPAVIGHEGSTLVVVFNALRLLGYKSGKK